MSLANAVAIPCVTNDHDYHNNDNERTCSNHDYFLGHDFLVKKDILLYAMFKMTVPKN